MRIQGYLQSSNNTCFQFEIILGTKRGSVFPKITQRSVNIEQLLEVSKLMRIGFLSEICRQSRALISAKKWRVWEEFLNWHFLENKNAHDLRNNTVDLGI